VRHELSRPANSSPLYSRAKPHRWRVRAVERRMLCCEATDRRNAPCRDWLADTDGE